MRNTTASLLFLGLAALTACDGAEGPAGPSGAAGPAGAVGPTGAAGPTGAIGPTGSMGLPGTDGMDGLDGMGGPAGMTGATGPTGAPSPVLPVIAPYLDVYGRSQAEWSAQWWRWVLSVPAADNPLFDTTGASCATNQDDDVFFLVGALAQSSSTATVAYAQATRTCTVPFGKPIYFPVVNYMFVLMFAPPEVTEADMIEAAEYYGEPASGLVVELDGVSVPGLSSHVQDTGAFDLPFPDGSLFDGGPTPLLAGTTRAADHGYYVMLAPLAPGTHTLRFRGVSEQTLARHGYDFRFELDVTYTLIVPPG